MAYTLSLLTTAADCDSVIKFANSEKKDLDMKILVLTKSLEDSSETITDLDAELLAANASVTSLTTMIAGLQEGKTKDKNKRELKREEYSLYLLNERRGKNGSAAQLEGELELACITQRQASFVDFITSVTAHKATL